MADLASKVDQLDTTLRENRSMEDKEQIVSEMTVEVNNSKLSVKTKKNLLVILDFYFLFYVKEIRDVFAYGSLLFRLEFDPGPRVVGRLEGYQRKFWVWDPVYRGTQESKGLAVTIVESPHMKNTRSSWVYGQSINFTNVDDIRKMHEREISTGEYVSRIVTFIPEDSNLPSKEVLVYIALPGSQNYAGPKTENDGPKTENDISQQIVNAEKGSAGYNIEYVMKLDTFIVENGLVDPHVSLVAEQVKKMVNDNGGCWRIFMDDLEYECKHCSDKEKKDLRKMEKRQQ